MLIVRSFARAPTLAAILTTSVTLSGLAGAVSAETIASFKPDQNMSLRRQDASASLSLSAYLDYVKQQADLLVGMTRVLANEIKAGDLDAAQAAYAPSHRYLAHLAPVVRLLHGLDERLDAQADGFAKKEADPQFSGFHRIEHALFAAHATKDVTVQAAALLDDVRTLRERLKAIDVTPDRLVLEAAGVVSDMAATSLDGAEERYARTDLWDIEARIGGVREVINLVQPALKTRADTHLVKIDALLERHKAGCGYKDFDEVSKDDKAALKREIAALAGALATPQGAAALD